MSSRMLSSPVSNVVSVLLGSEKDDMRRWLRAEMDQLVDPFIDRLFDKLGSKLTSALGGNELADCGDQMGMNESDINLETPNVQMHQSSALNYAQPQPDELINHTTNFNQPLAQSTQCHLICHPSTSFDSTSSSHQVQHNANYDQEGQTNVQVQVKEELDESTSERITTNQFLTIGDDYRDTQHNEHQPPNEHVNGDIDNDDDAHNSGQTQIKQEVDEQQISTDQTQYPVYLPITNQTQSNQPNLHNQTEYENYDWNSDENVDGIEIKDEDRNDDNDESDALLEPIEINQNADEDCWQPAKKIKLDQAQLQDQATSNTVGQHHQQQYQNQIEARPIEANNHYKLYITLSIQCPQCPQVFVQNETSKAVDQLKHHLQAEHFMSLYRCALKHCGQTFDNLSFLDEHIKQAHRHITDWHCAKCPSYYTSNLLLSHHNRTRHYLGQYQCTFPRCAFIGDCRESVHSHYSAHFTRFVSEKGQLMCAQSGCGRRFTNDAKLKIHQRTHLGMVPYRCTWPSCLYIDSSRPNTIVHIRKVHLKPNMHLLNLSESVFNDPKDYYEVAQDLM